MSPDALLDEVTREITKHQLWGTWGFYGLQILIWGSIVSSTAAAILTSIGKGGKPLVAFFAAVPALVLTAEATFRYSDRYQYHDKAAATIAMQRNAYAIRKEITIEEFSRWWDEYRTNGPIFPAPKLIPKKDEPSPPASVATPKPAPTQPAGSSASVPSGAKSPN